MRENIKMIDGTGGACSLVSVDDGEVKLSVCPAGDGMGAQAYHDPAQARALAAALLRAADDVEG